MFEFFRNLFDSQFVPHGHCFLWRPDILWTDVISDGITAFSYYIIPLGLIYFARRRRDLAFSWMFVLFGMFILSCGTTHVMSILTLWHPFYRLEALFKALTAVSSLPTAAAFIYLIPKALELPRPDDIRKLNAELEQRVQERTAELHRANERLKAITESSPLAIWTCDADFNVTFWNPASERLYGWRKDEVMGRPVPNVPDEEREAYISRIRASLSGTEDSVSGEARRMTKSGEPVDVSYSMARLRGDGTNVSGYLAVVADICERKLFEKALRQSEQQFRTLADSIPQLAWMAGENGWTFWYNQRWYDYTGTTLDEMEGWGWQKVHHPDHVDRVVEGITKAWQSGEPWEDTFPLRGKNGEWRWFLSRALPIRNEADRVVRWFGTNTDVTEQREAVEATRASEARFRQLADAMPQFVWVTRPDGYAEYFNRRWHDYTGLTFEESCGTGWLRACHPEDTPATLALWETALSTGAPLEVEYRARRQDGEYRWLLGRALPAISTDGSIERWYATSTDIQDQKRTETELRRANADLRQFAYAASHDLQEPLRNMSIYSELLERSYRGKLNSDADTFLRYICDGARRMKLLLEDLLAYTETAGTTTDRVEDVDSAQVLRDTIQDLSSTVQESGASIESGEMPVVRYSRAHLSQVLQNLIANAIKYRRDSHPPRVRISATKSETEWRFAIEDNGIGIDPQYHGRIFGLFKRLHGGDVAGTGIGLAICQKIVEQHGGRIWLESHPGKGSTFYFTIPI